MKSRTETRVNYGNEARNGNRKKGGRKLPLNQMKW